MLPPVFEFLSFRTFSSVWYWIAVAVLWAVTSQRPMGVPYDMVWRALRDEEQAQAQLEAVAGAFAGRLTTAMARGGTLAVALGSALLTALVLLAVLYGLELAQGVALIALPMALVGWLNLRAARAIDQGGDPARHLRRLRASTQAIAVVSLFVAAFWGMYVNLMVSVLR